MRRVTTLILAVLLVAVAVSGLNALLRQPPAATAARLIPWRDDYSAALDEGRRDHKQILLYFTATWCGPCQEMKTTTWADSQVAAALNSYVPVEIDVDQNRALAAKFTVTDLPSFFVIDPDTNKIQRYTYGGYSPDDFVHWLKG
jgi:thiol:disulfide interchange protein